MKKALQILYVNLLAFMLLFPMLLCAEVKVMLIADPHVLTTSLVEEGDAFDAMMNQQRKMIHLSQVAFTSLVDTALLYKPAFVLIPGDLTKDGELESHNFVAQQIKRLNDAGIKALVIPGNHDIDGKAFAYRGSEKVAVDALTDAEWENKYAFVYEQAVAKDPLSHSYVAEPISGVTILGLDASHSTGEGSLSDATLSWVLSQADAASQKGNMVIAMCHWQVLEHVDEGEFILESALIQDAEMIRDSLMAHNVRLLLTGHMHINSISTYRDTLTNTGDSIVEISTGSPITYPSPYRWLTISDDRSTISVETDYLTALPNYGDLNTYGCDWMREHTQILMPTLALQWFEVTEYIFAELLLYAGVSEQMLPMFLAILLPQTDEEKNLLFNKYLAQPIIDLYLLHSEANEPANPQTDSLAQAMYDAIGALILEMTGVALESSPEIQQMLALYMIEISKMCIQSLVEDRTQWTSAYYSDCTDDLQITLTINESQTMTALENINPISVEGLYDILGRRVIGEQLNKGQIYIQDGLKVQY